MICFNSLINLHQSTCIYAQNVEPKHLFTPLLAALTFLMGLKVCVEQDTRTDNFLEEMLLFLVRIING